MSGCATTVGEAFLDRVRNMPKETAQCCRDEQGRWRKISWAELQTEVLHCAGLMRALGLRRGERIAIISGTRREWQVAELAGYMNGAVVAGVDPHATSRMTARLLEQIEPAGLILQDRDALNKIPLAIRSSTKFIFMLDALEASPDREAASNTILFWKHIQDFPYPFGEGVECKSSSTDVAAMIFTSGSGGEPKAIEYSHAQLLAAATGIGCLFSDFGTRDRQLCWLPLAHLFQRILNLACMIRGVESWFCDDPRCIMDCIRVVQPSFLICVPRFLEKLQDGILKRIHSLPDWKRQAALSAVKAAPSDAIGYSNFINCLSPRAMAGRLIKKWVRLSLGKVLGARFKFMVTGAAPISTATLTFFKNLEIPVLEAYGLSENAVPMAINTLQHNRMGSVGRPLDVNRVQIACDGEILVKGPGVFSGYHLDDISENGKARSGTTFTSDGYLKTGDLGRFDADGFLYLIGRKKETIKTATGRNISPSPIEALYRSCSGVEEVVLFGHGKPFLVALMVTGSKDGVVDKIRLREDLEKVECELPSYARVRKFLILPNPLSIERGELTTSLKVRRNAIERIYRIQIDALYRHETRVEKLQDLAGINLGVN